MEEIWKDIIGYEGLYQISNLGRVKSLSRFKNSIHGNLITKEKFLKPNPDNRGYRRAVLTLNGKTKLYKVHRLLAIHFIPNPDKKLQVNHINGIKYDNRLENLEWCTPKENTRHAVDTGLKIPIIGEKHGRSKLTDMKVLDIKQRLKSGEKGVNIANLYNVGITAISNIKNKINWKHVLD